MKNCLLLFILAISSTALFGQSEATFYTNHGNFELVLYDTNMPITAGNFTDLVNAEFYDNTIFHRVIGGFVIQGGDPTGTGSGGPGYTIQDEFDSTTSNLQYTIAMANTGAPNSGGSQFFVNLVDNIFLDFDNAPLSSAHPIFGEVISGFNVVDSIGNTPTNASDRPLSDVVIDSIRITFIPPPVSVADIQLGKPQISIYPNPASAQLHYSIAVKEDMAVTVYVLDMNGRLLNERAVELSAGLNVFPLDDLEKLNSGLYQLVVADDKGDRVSKAFQVP